MEAPTLPFRHMFVIKAYVNDTPYFITKKGVSSNKFRLSFDINEAQTYNKESGAKVRLEVRPAKIVEF
jgi:hypothetical protein